MFLEDLSEFRVYIRPGNTDMRKSIHTLSVLVQDRMQLDPLNRSLFIFCNRRRNILKILYWDKNGFCLWMKHLVKVKFPWTADEIINREISLEEMKWLLSGIDFFHKHERLKYSGIN